MCDMCDDWERTQLKDLIKEYNQSLDRQTEAISQIQNKSAEVIKINFLVIGALVTGSSIFFSNYRSFGVYIIATAICFVFSTSTLISAYSTRFYKHGWGYGDIDDLVRSNTPEIYYEATARSYNYWIGYNRVEYRKPLLAFRQGLWAALTGIFCFSFVIFELIVSSPEILILPPYPLGIDLLIIYACGVVALYGYDSTKPPDPDFPQPLPPSIDKLNSEED